MQDVVGLPTCVLLQCRDGVRLVTQNDVSSKDCQRALDAIMDVLGSQEAAKGFSNTYLNGTGKSESFAPTGYSK